MGFRGGLQGHVGLKLSRFEEFLRRSRVHKGFL